MLHWIEYDGKQEKNALDQKFLEDVSLYKHLHSINVNVRMGKHNHIHISKASKLWIQFGIAEQKIGTLLRISFKN